MRSAALILDQVAHGGAVREGGRLRGTSPFVDGGCEVATCDEFGQELRARPAVHSDHACDRSAVFGDHHFPALPDLREIAAKVVFQLSNPNGIYSHIHRAIIATSRGAKVRQARRYSYRPRRTRSAPRASASASSTGGRERVDHIHICVSAEPDVAAVDPPYAVLPHQRNEVGVGHVVAARLVAARLTEQVPESVRLAWCTHVRPLEKGFGVGGRIACAKRLREDRGVRNDAQVTEYHRPEQIQKVGSSRQAHDQLYGLRVDRITLIACVDEDVGVDGCAHPRASSSALTASLSSRSTNGRPRSLAIHARPPGSPGRPSSTLRDAASSSDASWPMLLPAPLLRRLSSFATVGSRSMVVRMMRDAIKVRIR